MTHIQQRRGSASEWSSVNPTLFEGEAGHETDTGKWKMGDGVTDWVGLPYKPGVQSVAGQTGIVTLSIGDVAGAIGAASPALTGNPTAPTPNPADNDTSIATTAFVKTVVADYAPLASPALTGNPTAPTPITADNDTSIATTAFVKAVIAAAKLEANPIGTIYESTEPTNPGTFIGGTWAAYAPGRVLVAIDAGDPDFDTSGETRGAKTHVLTIAEMPNHSHNVYIRNTTGGNGDAVASSGAGTITSGSNLAFGTGGGGAHNNIQPSVVVYRFRRTA